MIIKVEIEIDALLWNELQSLVADAKERCAKVNSTPPEESDELPPHIIEQIKQGRLVAAKAPCQHKHTMEEAVTYALFKFMAEGKRNRLRNELNQHSAELDLPYGIVEEVI